MKDLSISATNHRELKNSSKKWLAISSAIIISQIFLLSFIHHKQKAKLEHTQNEVSTLEIFINSQQPILEAQKKLKKDYESLIHKKAHLTGNTELLKLILKKIIKSIPEDCCLSNLIFKNNIISMKGVAKTWLSLHHFFDTLSETEELGSIKLKSATKETEYLNFEIEFSGIKKIYINQLI